MNTKTMRLPPRRVLTPTKRKERDDYKPPTTKSLKPTPAQPESYKAPDPDSSSNQLLAGYLAYEYLTKGTLFGQPFDAAGEQAGSGQVSAVEPRKVKPEKKDEAEPQEEEDEENYKRYVEVASLLKTGGAHISGIVNPTQLARFLHMWCISITQFFLFFFIFSFGGPGERGKIWVVVILSSEVGDFNFPVEKKLKGRRWWW